MKFLILLSLCALAVARDGDEIPEDGIFDANDLAYLESHGYLKTGNNKRAMDAVADAIKALQTAKGLEVTGKMNKETKQEVKKSFCMSDAIFEKEKSKDKKYSLSLYKWTSPVTWKINSWPTKRNPSFTNAELEAVFESAFQLWADVSSQLTFTKTSETAMMNIEFYNGTHDDTYPFDFGGPVAAHAFYPTKGKVHFDDYETWSLVKGTSTSTTYLPWVAAHEIGHALGLKHSGYYDLMRTVIPPNTDPTVTADDRNGIIAKYGA